MPKNTHINRRLRDRLPGISVQAVIRVLRNSHGFATSHLPGVRAHWITIQNQQVKAIYDWKKHRLVTVIVVGKEAR